MQLPFDSLAPLQPKRLAPLAEFGRMLVRVRPPEQMQHFVADNARTARARSPKPDYMRCVVGRRWTLSAARLDRRVLGRVPKEADSVKVAAEPTALLHVVPQLAIQRRMWDPIVGDRQFDESGQVGASHAPAPACGNQKKHQGQSSHALSIGKNQAARHLQATRHGGATL